MKELKISDKGDGLYFLAKKGNKYIATYTPTYEGLTEDLVIAIANNAIFQLYKIKKSSSKNEKAKQKI